MGGIFDLENFFNGPNTSLPLQLCKYIFVQMLGLLVETLMSNGTIDDLISALAVKELK